MLLIGSANAQAPQVAKVLLGIPQPTQAPSQQTSQQTSQPSLGWTGPVFSSSNEVTSSSADAGGLEFPSVPATLELKPAGLSVTTQPLPTPLRHRFAGTSYSYRRDGTEQTDDGKSAQHDEPFDPLSALPDDLFGDGDAAQSAAQSQSQPNQPPPTSEGSLPQPRAPTRSLPQLNPLDALPEEVQAVPDLHSPSQATGDAPGIQTPLGSRADGASLPGPPNNNAAASNPSTSTVPKYPQFFPSHSDPPIVDPKVLRVPYEPGGFIKPAAVIVPEIIDPLGTEAIYRGKFPVPVQRPIVEWGRPYFTGGIYPPGLPLFGEHNLIMPHFMVYGDYRVGGAVNRNTAGDSNVIAQRLNLDLDWELTATERIHGFLGPMDRGGDFTRIDFSDGTEFVNRHDMRFDTLFFEGDAGAILGGVRGTDSPFDIPFTFGFIPLIYQNGIWADDNVIGAAMALPAKHNRLLNWSNYDATFFWASDQVTTDAFAGDNNAAEFFGTAWFIDAYDGYIEADYAFVNDDVGLDRSYHNLSFGFTRRYFMKLSNSIRFITNLGQSLPDEQKTASGHLLLFENSLISVYPNTFVPYFNLFYGQGSPQSLARAGIAGGVLNNVGINFENDGLTGYPTLDPTGHNTYGAALGMNILGASFGHQLILELAALAATGSDEFRNADGDQYALGMRYQKPLNNAWLIRTDHMYGWLRNAEDIRGSRLELRWKF